ncbi:MAG: hypothetical protein JSV88_25600 [Candidatus Aminicenantes bacterium]|nr:MAG: hypothetical protein JSV88_25600 [Candidatus Aminicenantes bacterium]
MKRLSKVFAGVQVPPRRGEPIRNRVPWSPKAFVLLCVFFVCVCVQAQQLDPDRIEIVSSYFGAISRISDPVYKISVIDENMELREKLWREMCRRVANNGASAIRMMPFWPPEKEQDVGYMPFVWEEGKYNLDKMRESYFTRLRKMVKIANEYLKVYFSLYEACGMRKEFRMFNPWYNNHNNMQDFRRLGLYADKYRGNWERKILITLGGLNVGYELCNEPKFGAEAMFKVYKRLRRWKISDENIIMGIEWNTPTYREWRNLIIERWGEEAWVEKKHILFSTVHGLTADIFSDLYLQEGHTRRFWLSVDGLHPKPDADWWEQELLKFFDEVPTAAFKNRYACEAMHKKTEDDFDSAKGISEAIFKHTGKWPKNYGKFPKDDDPEPNPCELCLKELFERIEKKHPGLLDMKLKVILSEIFNDI